MLDKLIELEINVDLQFVEPILQAVKEEMQNLRRVLDDEEIHDLVRKITN
jgi:hypothetical protein